MSSEALKGEYLGAISAADTLDALEAVRVAALGKAGGITQLMKSLGGLAPEERLKVAERITTDLARAALRPRSG